MTLPSQARTTLELPSLLNTAFSIVNNSGVTNRIRYSPAAADSAILGSLCKFSLHNETALMSHLFASSTWRTLLDLIKYFSDAFPIPDLAWGILMVKPHWESTKGRRSRRVKQYVLPSPVFLIHMPSFFSRIPATIPLLLPSQTWRTSPNWASTSCLQFLHISM